MRLIDFLKPYLNFYYISLILFLISLISTIYSGADLTGFYSPSFSNYKGIEGLLFGWTFSTWAIIPWLANLLYGYLILFGRFFPYSRTAISLVMITLSLFIFELEEITVHNWKFTYHYHLKIESGIYCWLIAIILLSLHFFLADLKHYKKL